MPNTLEELFGKPIYTYTRKQALADGFQVDVSQIAKEAGLRFPCFLTRAVWDQYVEIPPGVTCQDEKGRLWDIAWMTRFAIIRGPKHQDTTPVELRVRMKGGLRRVLLKAQVSAMDIDDPQPAITIRLPDED